MTPEELNQASYQLNLRAQDFQEQKARRDWELRSRELDRDKGNSRWTAISVVVAAVSITVSAVAGGFSIRETARLQHESARTQFAIKAAELVLQSDDPEVNANKAARFQLLFPEQKQPSWPKEIGWWKRFATENDDMKLGLAKLLAEQPRERKKIIAAYRKLFDDDNNVQCSLDRLTGEFHPEHKCEELEINR
jgi:hypothetical protein